MSTPAPSSIEMLKPLVAFDTTSRNSNLELIKYIQGYLDDHGVQSTLVPNAEGTKANLFATIGPEAEGGVVLSGHTDVVPVDGQPWDTDPWELTEKRDGKLYGRGTCDMKGFMPPALAPVPALQRARLKVPMHFAFSYDEEIGCLGAHSLAERLVAGAAGVEIAVGLLGQGPGIGVPWLAVDRHDVGVARQHDAALGLGPMVANRLALVPSALGTSVLRMPNSSR